MNSETNIPIHHSELQFANQYAERIQRAAERLFGDAPLVHRILQACDQFRVRCNDIVFGRGVPVLTIAIIGLKGQGKSWIARQLILDKKIHSQMPSGILNEEATIRLQWIGSVKPDTMHEEYEQFVSCPANQMVSLGAPYMLLDTPGITDSNSSAASIARQSLSLAPIQLLAIRRDQLKAAMTSPIVMQSEGVICIPVITAVPLKEMASGASQVQGPVVEDVNQWLTMVQQSAPQTQIQLPIFVADFEATGDENAAGELIRNEIKRRLADLSLEGLAKTSGNRLAAATNQLRLQVHRAIDQEASQLSASIARLQQESKDLPRRAIESVLGSPVVLETAIRSRLRTQFVTDTSSIWFPYRSALSLLSITHGAWDRLTIAMTGSLPSLFGTLVAITKNIQDSRKSISDVRDGLRAQLDRQMHDQLGPIHLHFQRSVSRIRGTLHSSSDSEISSVRLGGVDEIQSRSQKLFEDMITCRRSSPWLVNFLAIIGFVLFWCLLAGPVVAVYRQYFTASIDAVSLGNTAVESFPHPPGSLIATSLFLSFVPLLIYAMVVLSLVLRRSKIQRLARQLQLDHQTLLHELESQGILRLEYNDPLLEEAMFLTRLGG